MENTEIKQVMDNIQSAFAEFKKTNDARLEMLEAQGNADGTGELQGKLDKLNNTLTALEQKQAELEAKMERPSKPQGNPEDGYTKSFDKFLRKGVIDETLESKSINTGTGSEGGYAVPSEMSKQVYDLLREATPMRQVCKTIKVSTEEYSQLIGIHGASAGWVGETSARPETTAPKFAQAKPVFGELYANPFATQKALDDLFFDVEAYIKGEIVDVFAEQENAAFTNGDGSNKPKGLFAYTQSTNADGARAANEIQVIKTTSFKADDLIDLYTAVKTGYHANGRFMLNASTLAAIRKFKDDNKQYIWQPGVNGGTPSTIFGYQYTVNPDVDSIAANKLVLAFGDFKRAYTIVDRVGIRVTRDPYTNKPYVGFYTTKRVGGMLVDNQAVKFLKVVTQ